MGEEILRSVMDLNFPRLDKSVHFALALLPAFRPEPFLVCWDRNLRMQFDDSVIALDDFNLRAGLIEVVATTNPSREGESSPRLDAHVNACHVQKHITALRYCSKTALRLSLNSAG